jgi:hypothetical protein
VIFSASEREADLNRAFSLGAKEFIHKPLDLDDYKTAVTENSAKVDCAEVDEEPRELISASHPARSWTRRIHYNKNSWATTPPQ